MLEMLEMVGVTVRRLDDIVVVGVGVRVAVDDDVVLDGFFVVGVGVVGFFVVDVAGFFVVGVGVDVRLEYLSHSFHASVSACLRFTPLTEHVGYLAILARMTATQLLSRQMRAKSVEDGERLAYSLHAEDCALLRLSDAIVFSCWVVHSAACARSQIEQKIERATASATAAAVDFGDDDRMMRGLGGGLVNG